MSTAVGPLTRRRPGQGGGTPQQLVLPAQANKRPKVPSEPSEPSETERTVLAADAIGGIDGPFSPEPLEIHDMSPREEDEEVESVEEQAAVEQEALRLLGLSFAEVRAEKKTWLLTPHLAVDGRAWQQVRMGHGARAHPPLKGPAPRAMPRPPRAAFARRRSGTPRRPPLSSAAGHSASVSSRGASCTARWSAAPPLAASACPPTPPATAPTASAPSGSGARLRRRRRRRQTARVDFAASPAQARNTQSLAATYAKCRAPVVGTRPLRCVGAGACPPARAPSCVGDGGEPCRHVQHLVGGWQHAAKSRLPGRKRAYGVPAPAMAPYQHGPGLAQPVINHDGMAGWQQ